MSLVKNLLEVKKSIMTEKGESAEFISHKIENDVKEIEAKLQTKAVLDTVTTNNGAEYVPAETNEGRIVDLMVRKGGLVSALNPGFLGTNLRQNTAINIRGEVGQAQVLPEYTTGQFFDLTPTNTVITDKVLANSKILTANVGVSYMLEKYSVIDALALAEDAVATQIEQAIEDAVLNADSATGATGNINSDDQLAATTYGATASIVSYNNGLRKGIVNGTLGSDNLNITGVSGFNDIANLIKLLPSDFNPADYVVVMDHKTNAEFMQKDDFKKAMDRANTGDSNTSQTGVFNRVAGMPIVVSKFMRLTEADGKVSGATPANNTKGTVMLVKRNVIQHGFLDSIDSMVQKIVGR